MTGPRAAIGLVAGGGRLPLLFAESARRAGHRVVAAALAGQALPALEGAVDALVWFGPGELLGAAAALRAGGADRAVLLGAVDKARLLGGAGLSAAAPQVAARAPGRGDDGLLRAAAAWLGEQGLPVVDPAPFLADRLAPEGVLGRCAPTGDEWADARLGLELARAVGRLDVGQTVVVKDGVAVAVEALEGTDACIRRGGALVAGAVVAKAVKPQQDRRFDLPAVGPETIEALASARARVLAVEAGGAILVDQGELVRRADAAGVAVVGIR